MGLADQIRNLNPFRSTPVVKLKQVHDANLKMVNFKNTAEPETIIGSVDVVQLYRRRVDVLDWRNALNKAESTHNPSRVELIRLFNEIALDTHITALTQTIVNRINSQECIITVNNNPTEDLDGVFKNPTFEMLVQLCLESEWYGYSLIEFPYIDEGDLTPCLIPREYVIPEWGIVTDSLYSTTGLKFDDEPYDTTCMFVGHQKDLGLFAKAAPHYIGKKITMSAWTEYNERHGLPFVFAKADLLNDKERQIYMELFQQMSGSTNALFPRSSEVSMIQPNASGAADNFKEHVTIIDQQFSKLFLGGTMVLDDGSSRSQSEVHERNLQLFDVARLRKIENVINYQLIPLLAAHGIVPENTGFKYEVKETLSLQQRSVIDLQLARMYDIPVEHWAETYGVEVIGEKTVNTTPAQDQEAEQQLENLYK